MSITKTGANVVSSQSSSAGSAQDAVNSGDLDFTLAYEAGISGKVTNGATGPTVGCTVNLYVGRNSSNYFLYQTLLAGVANNGVYPFAFAIPDWASFAKIGFGGNTGQAVTVIADREDLTAI